MIRYELVTPRPVTWGKIHLYGLLGASMLASLAAPEAASSAEAVRTAALPPATQNVREADLPSVLAFEDAQRYRRIFDLQDAGNWAASDRDIAEINDRVLLGDVLAQRYLHRGYHTQYQELADWLASYADLPIARAIYPLALKRHPVGAPAPAKPAFAQAAIRSPSDDDFETPTASPGARSAADLERAYRLKDSIRRLAQVNPAKAEAILAGSEAKLLLDDADMDEARGIIAEGYLSAGDAQRALELSANGHGAAHPTAEWEAGLADWRLKQYSDARKHFEAAAKSPAAGPLLASAAAFWAARTALRNRHPELVNYWLGVAAQHPHTFYGLLARRTLGVDTYFNFDNGAFTEADARAIMSTPGGRRALAFLQIGDIARADVELRGLAARGDVPLRQSVAALADRANLPALSFQIAAALSSSSKRDHDRALFPVPQWTPQGGFTVDRALLFALMRQESQFLPDAKSQAGAVGLMQLMPATAHSLATRIGMTPHGKPDLTDPEVSLTLAQEYIGELTGNAGIGKSLLLIAAAYNSGPAPIQRWLASPELRQDPLLFVESIPSRETRSFTRQVMANYWIYRQRLGQPTPDLDALAAGRWPTYTAFDAPSGQGGRYAAN